MADTTQSSLFELALDHESIDHLTETARWGKFLAVAGFLTCGVLFIFSFFVGSLIANSVNSTIPQQPETTRLVSALGGIFFTVIYIVFAAVYFFPCLFLYRYSVRMKAALKTNDQVQWNQSLKAQKYLFRYMGILTIIGLAFLILEVLAMMVFGLFALHR
ncbi:MAG TPA: hypothetical protein VL978_07890 [Puia sp.]|nr:hypothetical protein [Puia sp.]